MASPQSGYREPLARYFHAAVASSRHLLIWGGHGGGLVLKIEASAVDCFDVLSATWAERRQLSLYIPGSLNSAPVACDEARLRAYTFGGRTGSGRINDLYEVDLMSLVCSSIQPSAHSAPPPDVRSDSAITISRRRLVNYGGDIGGGVASDELHVFYLDTSE